MRIEQFTIKMREALQSAQSLASDLGHQGLTPAHMFVALLDAPDGITKPLLERVGVSAATARAETEAWLERQPTVTGAVSGTPSIGSDLSAVIGVAEKEMKALKDEYLSVEHLLLGLVASKSPVADILKNLGLTKKGLMQALTAVRGTQRVTDEDPEGKYEALEKYGSDLTALAEAGKIDPVIGRDDEIRRVMQVLSRRTQE